MIRPEPPADIPVVFEVNRRAFGQQGEAVLVTSCETAGQPAARLLHRADAFLAERVDPGGSCVNRLLCNVPLLKVFPRTSFCWGQKHRKYLACTKGQTVTNSPSR